MMIHASIPADDPERVARVIAELWRGTSEPAPYIAPGLCVARTGDDRGTQIEEGLERRIARTIESIAYQE